MRIGTYNVLAFRGYPTDEGKAIIGHPQGEGTVDYFERVFRELDCDIIALQEGLYGGVVRSLCDRLGYNLATIPSPGSWPGLVFTRYPILESRVFSHFGADPLEKPLSRHAGAVLLDLGGLTRMWVVPIHLHPGSASQHRRAPENEIVLSRIDELISHTPHMVVLGDFNCQIEEPIHSGLKSRGFDNVMERTEGGLQYTVDTVGQPQRIIDHIYISPSLSPHLRSARVVRDPGFRHDGPQAPGLIVHSDHLPVIAEVDSP